MRTISPAFKLALLALAAILIWSALFAHTYTYPFYWDDLHFIRTYSSSEILGTFHGLNDPDGIETKALRPVATLLFHFQGTVFGENLLLQRLFMAGLMFSLLLVVGLLLKEAGLSFYHIAVVFALFAFSRVFASLILWITLGSLVLSYIFMVLTALFYMRWMRSQSRIYLILTLTFAALNVFTREEAYTLPVVLPLLWCISKWDVRFWRRAMSGAVAVALVLAVHFIMRALFVPDAPPIQLTQRAVGRVLITVRSALMPGGYQVFPDGDRLFSLLWMGFVAVLVLVFMRFSSNRSRAQLFGMCSMGVILCASAIGEARPFGVAMPSLAFFTAVSFLIFEVTQVRAFKIAVVGLLLAGVTVGVVGGIRRSQYVAEALNDNSATKILRDGNFLFDLYPKPATIPPERRKARMARFAALGIRSREDLQRLQIDVKQNPGYFRVNRNTGTGLFLEKYDYLSF